MEELEIGLYLENRKEVSKESFKTFVDEKIENKVLEYLNEKKSMHSKVKHIVHKKLQLQEYLKASFQDNPYIAKVIFHARTRMLNVKANYKNKYLKTNMNCPLGCPILDSQEHLLHCTKIEYNCLVNEKNESKYEDLFSEDSTKQIAIANILRGRLEKRKTCI